MWTAPTKQVISNDASVMLADGLDDVVEVDDGPVDEALLHATPKVCFSYAGIPQRDRRYSATLLFNDRMRRIDYMLAYQPANNDRGHKSHMMRKVFEENLLKEGLVLEYEPIEKSQDGKTCFIKIHAPWDYLTHTAQLMKIKMPIKPMVDMEKINPWDGYLDRMTARNPFKLDKKYHTDEAEVYTTQFTLEQAHQFMGIDDQDNFFTPSQRSRMVWDTLRRTGYDSHRQDRSGISQLLRNQSYVAAYPLHEGPYTIDSEKSDSIAEVASNNRQLLYATWARWTQVFKYQPLDLVRNYFGEKIALYFAWLGYYTETLIPAALVGLICIVYGAANLRNDIPSKDVCDQEALGSTVMCPQCDNLCPYWKLSTSCLYSQFTYICDNASTVLFAIFMSVWATLFLEFWKRKQSELAWTWDIMEYELEEEHLRPEFATRVKTTRFNPITEKVEPYLTIPNKLLRTGVSLVSVLFFLCLVIAFVVGVVAYRVIVVHLLWQTGHEIVQSYAKIATSITAAMLNLVIIIILGKVYQMLASYLTDLEQPRTQTEWNNSFTFKVFLFQFINYYSSLFYIAFFKGHFVGAPGSKEYSFAGSYRQEECDPTGCMIEVLIQLAVIMVGKQSLNNVMEILFPIVVNWWRQSKNNWSTSENTYTRWEKDFNLSKVPDMPLFYEYLEMVIQFGFVTLFVAAFPLAPFFALVNNLVEIRLDAFKFVVAYRRPLPQRAHTLGAWYSILDGVSKFAVLTNACVIAFTSDFVPRLIYMLAYSCDGSLNGYVNNSLAIFETADYDNSSRPIVSSGIDTNATFCRYRDYRNPPCGSVGMEKVCSPDWYEPDPAACATNKYHINVEWWHVFAARLGFVLVFELLVFLVKGVVAYLVPDVPAKISARIKREEYVSREARREYEFEKLAGGHNNNSSSATVTPRSPSLPQNLGPHALVDLKPQDKLVYSSPPHMVNGDTAQLISTGSSDEFHYSPHGSADQVVVNAT